MPHSPSRIVQSAILITLLAVTSGNAQLASPIQPPNPTELRVIYSTGFEDADWLSDWNDVGHRQNMQCVDPSDRSDVPAPSGDGRSNGKVLQVTVAKDGHYGCAPQLMFQRHLGSLPDEVYASYDVCFADNFSGYGGKAPGWSGIESVGWGGKPSDGINGWSARGGIHTNDDGTLGLSYYTYHARMRGKYGDSFRWTCPAATIKTGRWYHIDQYCKINTPGRPDGVLRAWVDGELVLDKTDVQMRNTNQLGLKSYWLNYYYGGKGVSAHERHVYLDDLTLMTPKR
ncbi:polysaccharide lyase [Crateriforma conspicua]|uniref:Polysaccharide lyase 14 domain-containing protein n=1 Tax=Crateriforma conspicua TaxID=2527996 RepID=A0A5C6FXJ3_9PLAN|nr:hypothetical protein [Crateriforma conspicua]TWU67639.1 hypothetical protein V7x_32150 [Crateriforma conspicua]